jgi:hypothetical protein
MSTPHAPLPLQGHCLILVLPGRRPRGAPRPPRIRSRLYYDYDYDALLRIFARGQLPRSSGGYFGRKPPVQIEQFPTIAFVRRCGNVFVTTCALYSDQIKHLCEL